MRQQVHKRSRKASRTTAVTAALVLAGSGVTALAVNASAGQEDPAPAAVGTPVRTVDCPDVGLALDAVPKGARPDVAKGVGELNEQVSAAYRRIAGADGESAEEVLAELREKRATTIAAVADTIAENGAKRPDALESMSACAVKEDKDAPAIRTTGQDGGNQSWNRDGNGDGNRDGNGNRDDGGGGQQQNGPVPEDFVDITTVAPNTEAPRNMGSGLGSRQAGQDGQGRGSTGTFTTECGVNEGGQFNSDNVIVAPGVSNGAQHVHDYVGNDSTDAFSDNESLAQAGTTCENGDLSTHYWPVLRALDGQPDGPDQGLGPGGQQDGNVGTILTPSDVSLTFSGSPQGDVRPMPTFLRIITGDAKSFTNGTDNANASWSCEGFEDRQLTDKYPLCPDGSRVIRSLKFQSCWDGRNIDSGNHRDHVTFAEEDGSCPDGFQAIPQLEQKVTYEVPQGGNIDPDTPFAVDTFPEQLHKPVTDHGDFINIMPEELMNQAVDCINSGQNCS